MVVSCRLSAKLAKALGTVFTPVQRRQRRLNKAMADGRSFKQRSTRVQSSAVPCESECDAVEAVTPCGAVDAMKPCTTIAIPEVSYAGAIANDPAP